MFSKKFKILLDIKRIHCAAKASSSSSSPQQEESAYEIARKKIILENEAILAKLSQGKTPKLSLQ